MLRLHLGGIKDIQHIPARLRYPERVCRLFAGVKELFPDDYAALRHDEEVLGFTLDNKKNLDEFIGDTQSCVCWKDKAAIHSILTGEFNTDDIYTNDWNYPVGAFHGADGGSC